MPFLIVLIFWISIIFANLSLFADPKPIVVGALFVFALSAVAAIFLVFESVNRFPRNNANFEYTSTQRTGAAVIRLRRNCAGARGL